MLDYGKETPSLLFDKVRRGFRHVIPKLNKLKFGELYISRGTPAPQMRIANKLSDAGHLILHDKINAQLLYIDSAADAASEQTKSTPLPMRID